MYNFAWLIPYEWCRLWRNDYVMIFLLRNDNVIGRIWVILRNILIILFLKCTRNPPNQYKTVGKRFKWPLYVRDLRTTESVPNPNFGFLKRYTEIFEPLNRSEFSKEDEGIRGLLNQSEFLKGDEWIRGLLNQSEFLKGDAVR